MFKIILTICLLLLPVTVTARGDTDWLEVDYDEQCYIEIEKCFANEFYSNDDTSVYTGFLLFLDNYNVLSKHYNAETIFNRVSRLSKENTKGLFLIEARLYLYGPHVSIDLDRALNIMNSSKYLDENNPDHAILLGAIYYQLYLKSKKTNTFYANRAIELLLFSYNYDERYSTRGLVVLLIGKNNFSDFKKAGPVLKYLAQHGGDKEKQYYQEYLEALASYPQK